MAKRDANHPILIVSGSRRIRDYEVVANAIERGCKDLNCGRPAIIIEGGQRSYDNEGRVIGGADYFARLYADNNGIPCQTYEAKWGRLGLAAGPIRNREMAQDGDYLIAIPDQESKGTFDMLRAMDDAGKHYVSYQVDV